jgi:hypothetical protein
MTVYSDDRSGEHGIGVDANFVSVGYLPIMWMVYFFDLMLMYVQCTRTVLRRTRRE